ncbi:DUF6415 family natural product biosynthesis protein [Streptomyces sp. NPDC001889]
MNHDTAPPSSPAAEEPDIGAMRMMYRRLLSGTDVPSLPAQLQSLTETLHTYVTELMPRVEVLIRSRPVNDQPALVAQAGLAEATRRVHTPPGFGAAAVYRHAERLARSVGALCDHYENLCHAPLPTCEKLVRTWVEPEGKGYVPWLLIAPIGPVPSVRDIGRGSVAELAESLGLVPVNEAVPNAGPRIHVAGSRAALRYGVGSLAIPAPPPAWLDLLSQGALVSIAVGLEATPPGELGPSSSEATDDATAAYMLRCARQQLLLLGAATLAPPAQS